MNSNTLTKYRHKYHVHSLNTPKITPFFDDDIVRHVALLKFLHIYVICEAKYDQTNQSPYSLTPLLIHYNDIFTKPQGFPPPQHIEHEINLVSDSSLPYRRTYLSTYRFKYFLPLVKSNLAPRHLCH